MGTPGPRSDGDLLRAVADRDRAALRDLYDRHAPWLRARLSRRCSDAGVVEEVLQDTFLAIWRKPESYRGSGDVPAWLWGIGIRRLLAAVRPRRPLPLRLLVQPPEPSAEDVVLLFVVGLTVLLAGIALLRSGADRRSWRVLAVGLLVAVVAVGAQLVWVDGATDWMGIL
jgi:Sigma-70 region 2